MTSNLTSNTNSDLVKVYSSEGKLLAAAYGAIMIFGTFANGLVAVTYLKWYRTLLKEPRDILILSLAVGDFMMSTCVVPLGFVSSISLKWTAGYPGCVWYGFLSTWVGLSTMLQLAVIALEQYLTLSRSRLTPSSRKRVVLATLFSWSVSFVVSCFPLFGWSNYTFEGLGLHCSIQWSAKDIIYGSYSLFLLLFFFLIPVGLITCSYYKIFCIVRQMSLNAEELWGSSASATKLSCLAKVKTTKQLFIVTSAFLFAWTPYALMSILAAFTNIRLSSGMQVLPAIFAKTSNIYNPVIYFFTYKRLRKKAFHLFRASNVNGPGSSLECV